MLDQRRRTRQILCIAAARVRSRAWAAAARVSRRWEERGVERSHGSTQSYVRFGHGARLRSRRFRLPVRASALPCGRLTAFAPWVVVPWGDAGSSRDGETVISLRRGRRNPDPRWLGGPDIASLGTG